MTVPGASPLGTKPPFPERADDNPGFEWPRVRGKGPDGPLEPMQFGDSGTKGKRRTFGFLFLKAQTAPRNPGGLGTAAQKEEEDICLYSSFLDRSSFAIVIFCLGSDFEK